MSKRTLLVTVVLSLTVFVAACDGPPPPADTDHLKLPASGVETLTDNFDGESTDWEFFDGRWKFLNRDGNGVLAQTASDLGRRVFPLALWKQGRFSDVDVSVRFQPISGEMDASGGVVFRARDGGNYYVARANSLENNIRLYTFIDGKRSQIAGTRIDPPALGEWHTLRAVAVGSRIQVWLDGSLFIDHKDQTYAEGYVGVWTKADAVTDFDDLRVSGVPAGK